MKRQKKIRLLLVDDEEAFLSSSSAVLSRRGFSVDTAQDGVSALNMIDRADYDVVVLDVKMPGMDGIDVLQYIRETHPAIPVILLTGHPSIDDAFESSRVGISRYLSKPIDMNVLAEQIRRVASYSLEDVPATSEDTRTEEAVDTIHVMLIDDEPDFLESMSRILRRRGMKVKTTTSGEDALTLLADCLIDVVVLDLKMPGMGGRETLRRIKTHFPQVEVIILTGHPSARSAMELIRLGANEYIEKPPKIDELVNAIRKLYDLRQRGILERQRKLIEEIRERYPD